MRSVFEAELADHIPVVKTSIQGTRLVGRMCVGKDLVNCSKAAVRCSAFGAKPQGAVRQATRTGFCCRILPQIRVTASYRLHAILHAAMLGHADTMY